jgi:subtilisin-like proprotein convertase family protein
MDSRLLWAGAAVVAAGTLTGAATRVARADVFGPGPGGAIADAPEIPAGTPGPPLNSVITVPNLGNVGSVNSVTLRFAPEHTWAGDLVVTLIAPNGEDVHVIARTGSIAPDDNGDSSDLAGPYTFVNGPGSPGAWTTAANIAPDLGPIPSGTYPRETLAPGASPPGADPDNFGVFAGDPIGGNWTLRLQDWAHFDTGGLESWTLNMTPAGQPVTGTWTANASGDWLVAGNWSDGVIPNQLGARAVFASAITSPRTVFADTGVTVGGITFDNANMYVLAGAGSLVIDVASGAGSIGVITGSHKINLPLFVNDNTTVNVSTGATLTIADPLVIAAGQAMTKTGTGTLRIISTVSGSAPATIDVSGGDAQVDFGIGTPASGSAAADAQVTLRVSGAARARFGANQTLRRLDAATATAGDQEIDLGGRAVRVYATDRAAEELIIYDDIRAARLSASGRDGIYDSTSPATRYAVGVTDQSLDAHGDSSVLVRLTREGDANCDGTVNLQDFNRLAGAFGLANQRWDNGDFNYDGTVNLTDFNRLAANFGLVAAGPSVTPQDWLRLGAAVPEPSSAMVVTTGAFALARRRRPPLRVIRTR